MKSSSGASLTLRIRASLQAKATKARQAQSRLKSWSACKKVAQAHIDSPFSFNFPAPGKVSDPLLTLSDASLGHGEHECYPKCRSR